MTDTEYLYMAAELAAKGLGHVRPNPAVGAVIVKNGEIIGRGWHKKAGGDHAEVAAIKNGGKRDLSDSTIYVTLEPCSKPGRVGACTDAIAAAGITRVVYAVADPNPTNRGKARRALAKHGIKCELFKGDKDLTAKCESLIKGFRKHVLTGLPYVTVKIAMSLDGRICDYMGDAKWISSAASRRHTGLKRNEVDAIMVGAETVRCDDPSLLCHQKRHDDLIRVIVSKSGDLPARARVFTDGAPNKTLVFNDAHAALEELGRMGVTSVLCEGGLNLARSLADSGLVDEWITVLAPVVIGSKPISKSLKFSRVSTVYPDASDIISTYSKLQTLNFKL